MQLWEKILQLALLGSERTHLDPFVEESLRQYRIDPEDPLAQVILSGAAALHQVRRLRLSSRPYDHPLPEPLQEEDAPGDLSPISLQHLKHILSGRFRRALPEYVQLLVERQLLLPPEFLPDLLDDCLQDSELWREVQPLLGRRAAWLIPQHPQWRTLAPQGEVARWPEAGFEERQLIFGSLREQAPQEALELLTTVWDNLSYRHKGAYLELLEKGISPNDEAFLERARQDNRKEVRLKAANLLATIPESALIGRIFAELIPLFSFDPVRERLEVILPKDIPDATAQDGIRPGVKKGKHGGLKTDWLFECVSRIPATYWMQHFDWTREALILFFDTTNKADLLLAALGNASVRFRDQELGTALIRYLVFKNGMVPQELDWQALVRRIPVADFQQMMGEFLERQPGLLEEKHLLTRMLELGPHPWNSETSRTLINGLKQWMSESKTFLWNLWHYKRLLETAAYSMPIDLLDELAADWPIQSPVWNQWAPDIERMLRIMRFRKEMKKALEE
jgi:hypothetical protein